MNNKKIMTTNEVMEYLGISRETLMREIKSKKIKAIKIRGVYRFLQSDIDDYINSSYV